MAQDQHDNNETGSEYQYHDDQQEDITAEYNYQEEAPIVAASDNKKKWVKPAMGGVIILAVLFFGYRMLFVSKPAPTDNFSSLTAQAPATNSVPTSAQLQTLTATEPASSGPQIANDLPASTSMTPAATQELSNKINELKEMNQSLSDKLEAQEEANQTSLTAVQQSVSSIGDQVSEVSKHVSALSSVFYKEQEAKQRAAYQQKLAKQQALAQVRQDKSYFVDAVIPGRAWLKAADGSTVTVTVGDTLPGYGKVLSIDPYSGAVKTTTAVISYAAE